MKSVATKEIAEFIENNIGKFHESRLKSLRSLNLKKILTRKNPYLFKAKNMVTASDLIKNILDAHLSSQEEALFGMFLEELAVFVCSKAYDGRKSSAEGIDLEFTKDNTTYLVSIKSGPNWGNSRQVAKMKDDFRKAKRILQANTKNCKVVAVNGCCYGKDDNPEKGDYLKLCGQRFWELISGNKDLYTDVLEPLGHKAKERNEEFQREYLSVVERFKAEFEKEYCTSGNIDWAKLVQFNSGLPSSSAC